MGGIKSAGQLWQAGSVRMNRPDQNQVQKTKRKNLQAPTKPQAPT
jgi:hypothetical protein